MQVPAAHPVEMYASVMGIPIAIPAWDRPVCLAIGRLLTAPPADARAFRRLLAVAARHGSELTGTQGDGVKVNIEGRTSEFEVATFLLELPAPCSQIERTLAWLALEAYLSPGHHALTLRLAPILRGLACARRSQLANTVAECDGPSALLGKMRRLGQHEAGLGITGHKTFDALWRDSLEAFCVWLLQQVDAPEPEDEAGLSGTLLSQPSALTEQPLDAMGSDPDEGAFAPSAPVRPDEPILEPKTRNALDWCNHLSRRSSPDLIRPMDNVLPAELRAEGWKSAVAATESALAD